MKDIIDKLERLKIIVGVLYANSCDVFIDAIIKDLKAYDDKVQALIKTCEDVIEFEKRNK